MLHNKLWDPLQPSAALTQSAGLSPGSEETGDSQSSLVLPASRPLVTVLSFA